MKIQLSYQKRTGKFFVFVVPDKQGDLPLRDLNYYATKAVLFNHFDELSLLDGVEKKLETEEYLSRELHHALEGQMPIKAHWYKVSNELQAEKIAERFSQLYDVHFNNIRRLSVASQELTTKTDVPKAVVTFTVEE